ncbi:histone-lysine N-methyltransferase, H3 lysine-79 specific-like [Tigriopus californicus]|uniref:histone-lysine N-methyltransferase, H3 lysine-79 specific-like n=1 Tax=Tigriopus californicus TaxID=6832 RepID=UPI0027DA85CF|nr:histone-lysine N-methyltransferase, H3 lysine-79 specific-like [Tigriopus californicus]
MGYQYSLLALLFLSTVIVGEAFPQAQPLVELSELDSQEGSGLGPSTGKALIDSASSSVPSATTATTASVRTSTFWRYVPLNSLTIGDMISQKDNETSTESSESDDRPVKLKPLGQPQQWWSYFSGKGDKPPRVNVAIPRTTTPIYEPTKSDEPETNMNGSENDSLVQGNGEQTRISLNVVDQSSPDLEKEEEEHPLEATIKEASDDRPPQATTIKTFTTKRRPRPTINRFVGSTNFYRPKPSRLTAFLSQAKRPVAPVRNGYQSLVIVNQRTQAQSSKVTKTPERGNEQQQSGENQTKPVQENRQQDDNDDNNANNNINNNNNNNDLESETLTPSTVNTESDIEEESTSLPDWYLTVYPNLGTNRKPSGTMKRPVKYSSSPSLKERIAENYDEKIPFPTFLQAIGGSSVINTAERPHQDVEEPIATCSEEDDDEACDEKEPDTDTTTLAGSDRPSDIITDESPSVDEQIETSTLSNNEETSETGLSLAPIESPSPSLPTFAPLRPLSSTSVTPMASTPSPVVVSSSPPPSSPVPSSPPSTLIQSDFTAESPVVSFQPTFENQLDDLISVNIRLLSTYQSQVNLQKQILDKLRKLRQSVASS